MSYLVEHVRFTLECDACGLVEKRDLDAQLSKESGTSGWASVTIRELGIDRFCCPGCIESTFSILNKRNREQAAALARIEIGCDHDYQQRGLLMQCTICKRWR